MTYSYVKKHPVWGKCINQREVRHYGDYPIYEQDQVLSPELKSLVDNLDK